jgi:hypothetical protein
MDGQQIDQLAKSLATGTPRRRALKAFVAGALGAGLLVRGTSSSEALVVGPVTCQALCHAIGDCEGLSGSDLGDCLQTCLTRCRESAGS